MSTNVTAMIDPCTDPVLYTLRMSSSLTVSMPMTISSPASAGIAMYSTAPANSNTMIAMTPNVNTSAQRLLAPADTTSDDADIDPPTGRPWNVPETRLPTP